jgi:natural product precursor
MKKLKLSNFDFSEILSREELKRIVGGDFGSGSGSGSGSKTGYPKIDACSGKKNCDPCSFMYNGVPSTGKCTDKLAPAYTMHCSNLVYIGC